MTKTIQELEQEGILTDEEIRAVSKVRFKKLLDEVVNDELERLQQGLGLSPHLYLNTKGTK